MTVVELKKSLHEKIDDLNDPAYLEMLNAMLSHAEEVFIIPEHMKAGVKQGMDDIRNGRTHTMEDFEKKSGQWQKG
jgi:predicted transcriptional regulator